MVHTRRSVFGLASLLAPSGLSRSLAASPRGQSFSTIAEPTVLRVQGDDGDQGGTQTTLDDLTGFRISPKARVKFQLLDSTISMPVGGRINLNHADGAMISLVGNQRDPSRVRANLPVAESQGFMVARNGYGIGDGFHLADVGGWISHTKWDLPIKPFG